MPKNPKADLHYEAAHDAIVRAEGVVWAMPEGPSRAAIIADLQKAKNALKLLIKAV
jgi:hypothetical protein